MQTIIMEIDNPQALILASDILLSGGIVAFPTDTVYGLGAIVFNNHAVSQISEVKGRTDEKAIPILLGEFSKLNLLTTEISEQCKKLGQRFWPGPLTMVLPRGNAIPDAVSPLPTIGVRIPKLFPTLELLKISGPLAVSSANLSGRGSSTTARGVQAQLDGLIPLILDGGVTPGGILPTLIDLTHDHPVILREGQIKLNQILKALE